MKIKFTLLLVVLSFAVLTACGGGSKSSGSGSGNPAQPLDPQGNWQFLLTDNESTPQTATMAGELYELNPPVVTSNGLVVLDHNNGYGCGGNSSDIVLSGQASGTDTITLAGTLKNPQPQTFSLTGTIALDQQHMSGTWTVDNPACGLVGGGNWTAQLVTPVNGNWSGNFTGQPGTPTVGTITVAMDLTEDTSQTSTTMGQVTGTVTIANSSCFSAPLTLSTGSSHVATWFSFQSAPDANGSYVYGGGTSPDANTTELDISSIQISGGACDGENFTGRLTKQ